jgi:antitoxin MazE
MKTRIVRLGNSQGIRIPKILLEQTGLNGEVEIRAREHSLVIQPAKLRRADWAAAFHQMAERGDDVMLDPATPSTWDEDHWEWR